mgnify:CR=1 FL=1
MELITINGLTNINDVIKSLHINNILDVGCGEGYYDRGIKSVNDINIVGLDISKEACLKASKLNKILEKSKPSSSKIIVENTHNTN